MNANANQGLVRNFFEGTSIFNFLLPSKKEQIRKLLNKELVQDIAHVSYITGFFNHRDGIDIKGRQEVIDFLNENM